MSDHPLSFMDDISFYIFLPELNKDAIEPFPFF